MIDADEERAVRMLAKRRAGAAAPSRRGVASSPRTDAEPPVPDGRGEMYLGSDAANFALLLARVWVGDHDLRPRLAAREGGPVGPRHGELVREPRR